MSNVKFHPKEYKVVCLRECPVPETLLLCDGPEKASKYWKLHVRTASYFDPERECFVVLILNTKLRIKGHYLVSIGTLDSTIIHAREVFRTAIVAGAKAIILMHNHPSGDTQPSQEDIRATREFVKAGQLVRIDVVDHVIVGHDRHASLRHCGTPRELFDSISSYQK